MCWQKQTFKHSRDICLGVVAGTALTSLLPSACGKPLHPSILEASEGVRPPLHPLPLGGCPTMKCGVGRQAAAKEGGGGGGGRGGTGKDGAQQRLSSQKAGKGTGGQERSSLGGKHTSFSPDCWLFWGPSLYLLPRLGKCLCFISFISIVVLGPIPSRPWVNSLGSGIRCFFRSWPVFPHRSCVPRG